MDEMCLVFSFYYPLTKNPFCVSIPTLSHFDEFIHDFVP